MTDEIEKNLSEIRKNLDEMDRRWRRWGIPLVAISWFLIGLLAGLSVCHLLV